MPYVTSEAYEAANKERFYLLYQTQAVAAAEVVSVTLNKDCNLVRVTITAGIATCRLRNAAAATVFDTTASASSPVSIMVGTNTNVLEITCQAAATLTISQMAVWGEFVSATLSSGSAPAAPAGWARPSDWLAMPTVGSGEQKFVGLFAVTNDASNYLALLFRGAYNVDWGDGTNQNVADNVRAEKLYDYATISAATESTRGYRQVLVTVTPQVGQNLTTLNLQQRHSRFASGYRSAPWLDMTINGANFTSLIIGGLSTAALGFLERVNIQTIGVLTSAVDMFSGCRAIREFSLFDTSSVLNFQGMYNGCSSAQVFLLINTAAGTSFVNMYGNTLAGVVFPPINTAQGLSFGGMYNGATTAQVFPPINTAAGTSFGGIYGNAPSGASVGITGSRFAISFAGMKLSRQAIADIFTGLGTASGAQTVTVTGNHGVPDLTAADLLIATNKGWTVAT